MKIEIINKDAEEIVEGEKVSSFDDVLAEITTDKSIFISWLKEDISSIFIANLSLIIGQNINLFRGLEQSFEVLDRLDYINNYPVMKIEVEKNRLLIEEYIEKLEKTMKLLEKFHKSNIYLCIYC